MDQITPLSNPAAERALVGCALLRPDAFDDAATLPADFELSTARTAWQAIGDLRKLGHVVTAMAVADTLRQAGAPASVLVDVTEWASASVYEQPQGLGRIVRTAAMARRLASACAETLARLRSDDTSAEDALSDHRGVVSGIESADNDDPLHVPGQMAAVLETIAERRNSPAAHAIPTGIRGLDDIIGGLKPKNQIVIAARPGEGKSALRMQICINAALAGFPVLLFSLEMSLQEEIERVLSGPSEVSVNRLASGRIRLDDVQRVYNAAMPFGRRDFPLWIYDKPVRLDKLESMARRWHARHVKAGQMAIVATDYLGLVRSAMVKGRNREQEIAEISRAGKAIAAQLDCVSLQVAQLNRESEKEQRDPRLSDLRESGSIEQDANMVIFPVRNRGSEDNYGNGPARLIIAKNRSGPTGEVQLTWNGRFTRFEDAESAPPAPSHYDPATE